MNVATPVARLDGWLQGLPADLPLTALDKALLRVLQERQPSSDARHFWLAALASHQFGRGHACLDLQALAETPQRLLGWAPAALASLPPDVADAAASMPWCAGGNSPLVLMQDECARRLYLRRAWRAEQAITLSLSLRRLTPATAPADLEQRLDALFPPDPIPERSAGQRQACAIAARSRLCLITGGPGTGKTTTVAKLLQLLAGEAAGQGRALRIHLAAPTGKAASRLSQSIGTELGTAAPRLQALIPTAASTLHRLLGGTLPLATDLVVVDEASMIDLEMMARLLEAVPAGARLVLLGDQDQLASVEAGAVLAQLCERPDLQASHARLRYSHRFAGDSPIGQWAAALNSGDRRRVQALWRALPDWQPGMAQPLQALRWRRVAAQPLAAVVTEGWQDWLQALAPLREAGSACDDATAGRLLDALARFQLLCALRSGPWGTEALNAQVRQALGFGRDPWFVGRPVMVTHNDYALKLMNGDVGLCLPRDGGLRVVFRDADRSLRWVPPSRLENVETVFAMTVHKSQGSEFTRVLLVLPDRESPVLTRELLYTGLTRAREGVTWLVPEERELLRAVEARVMRSGGLAG